MSFAIVPKLTFKFRVCFRVFCHGIAKEGDCKVVIYNYVFVGFNSVPNLIVILFNLIYRVFHVGFICKGCVRKRVCEDSRQLKTKAIFASSSRVSSREVKHVSYT